MSQGKVANMMMNNRSWKHIVLALLAGVIAVLAACGSDTGEHQAHAPPAGAKAAAGKKVVELGEWQGRWDGHSLSFTPVAKPAKPSTGGIHTQGFITLPDGSTTMETVEHVTVKSTCPADPPNNVFSGGTHALTNGHVCPNNHLCSLVQITNNAVRDVDSVFAQITDITPGFYGDGNPIAPVPDGYPMDNSLGLWSYGTLIGGGSGAGQVEWDFNLPNCGAFTFSVKVMGTVRRTSYLAGGAIGPQTDWIDACSLPGHTTILANAAPDTYVDNITPPFPFTYYDATFASDNLPFTISTNGAIGLLPITGDNTAMPDLSMTSDYTLFPFWDRLQLGSAGVCYGVTGSTPNRKFVVTWNNADIVSTTNLTENMTFSSVFSETTDMIEFLYKRWSDDVAPNDCTAVFPDNRSDNATIGVQATDGVGYTQYVAGLPVHDDPCPGNLYKVTLVARPGNL